MFPVPCSKLSKTDASNGRRKGKREGVSGLGAGVEIDGGEGAEAEVEVVAGGIGKMFYHVRIYEQQYNILVVDKLYGLSENAMVSIRYSKSINFVCI